MIRGLLVAVLALSFSIGAAAQPSATPNARATLGKRVALVIGNNAYPTAPLGSPVRDARDMAAALRAAGFSLVTGGPVSDADKHTFESAILQFGHEAENADAALFYYSGHGMEWDQQNWMIPVDSHGGRLQDVPLMDVSMDLVLQQITAAHARFSLVILDACRPNFLHPRPTHADGSSGGLGMMLAPENTIIAFATQPGDYSYDGPPGGNSLYTKQLLTVLATPGLELFQVFNQAALATKEATAGKQRPWTNYSPIQGEFYFRPRDLPLPLVASAVPPPPAAPARPTVPAPVADHDPSFTLVNLSGHPVEDLRVSLSTDRNWGENRVRDHQIRPGERLGVELAAGGDCKIDIRVTLDEGKPVQSSSEGCTGTTLVVDRTGAVARSNPDFYLVNGTAHPARAVYVSLTSSTNWGENRARSPLSPNDRIPVTLTHGVGCTVDVRAEFDDGTSFERRKVDTCGLTEWSLR